MCCTCGNTKVILRKNNSIRRICRSNTKVILRKRWGTVKLKGNTNLAGTRFFSICCYCYSYTCGNTKRFPCQLPLKVFRFAEEDSRMDRTGAKLIDVIQEEVCGGAQEKELA